MPGPAAKHPDERRRRNAKASSTRLTTDGTFAPGSPPLRDRDRYAIGMNVDGPIRVRFHPTTKATWNSLRRDPIARAFTDLDWRLLRTTVLPLLDRWIQFGDLESLKELRQQQTRFGLTPSARNALDWVIDPSVLGSSRSSAQERPARSARGRAADFRVVDGAGTADAS